MEKIRNLPSEIQWKIIKFMRHPLAEMVLDAQVDHTLELADLDSLIDAHLDTIPTELIEEREQIKTLLGYLRSKLVKW